MWHVFFLRATWRRNPAINSGLATFLYTRTIWRQPFAQFWNGFYKRYIYMYRERERDIGAVQPKLLGSCWLSCLKPVLSQVEPKTLRVFSHFREVIARSILGGVDTWNGMEWPWLSVSIHKHQIYQIHSHKDVGGWTRLVFLSMGYEFMRYGPI